MEFDCLFAFFNASAKSQHEICRDLWNSCKQLNVITKRILCFAHDRHTNTVPRMHFELQCTGSVCCRGGEIGAQTQSSCFDLLSAQMNECTQNAFYHVAKILSSHLIERVISKGLMLSA